MKFSFQTVFLLFLVTFVHLIVITTFSSLSGTSTDFLPEIDTKEIVENPVTDSVEQGVPKNPLKIAKSESAESKIEEQDDTEIVLSDTFAEAERDLPAIADARLLGERVSSPDLNSYFSDAASQVQRKKETEVVRAEPVAKKTLRQESPANEPMATSRLRSIRPIPRS